MAGGGDGDGALRDRRTDRGARRRPRAQRHPGPARTGAERRRGAAGRRHLGARPGRGHRTGRDRARQARRARGARRHRHPWPQRDRPVPRDRRKHPGRQGAGRSGVRGHHQRARRDRIPRHRGSQRHDPGTHHPCGRRGAGLARPDPALRRSLRGGLHAGRVRDRARGGRAAAATGGLAVARFDLQGAGAAGDRLSLRARDLDARDGRERPGLRGAAS